MLVRTSHRTALPLAAPHLFAQLLLNWPCPLAILADGPGTPPPETTYYCISLSLSLNSCFTLIVNASLVPSLSPLLATCSSRYTAPRKRHYPFPFVTLKPPDAGRCYFFHQLPAVVPLYTQPRLDRSTHSTFASYPSAQTFGNA